MTTLAVVTALSLFDDPGAKSLTLPSRVASFGELAADLGWSVAFTFADGPPVSVACRVARGDCRAFGLWTLEGNQARWRGGAANRIPGGHLRTLAALRAYVGGVA